MVLANRDGATAAHEPAESAAPRPLAGTAQQPRRPTRAPAKDAPCEPVESATTLPLATASQRLADGPDGPGRSPVVTILVTTGNASGRKCVCRRLVRQRGRRILRPVLLPDPGC